MYCTLPCRQPSFCLWNHTYWPLVNVRIVFSFRFYGFNELLRRLLHVGDQSRRVRVLIGQCADVKWFRELSEDASRFAQTL